LTNGDNIELILSGRHMLMNRERVFVIWIEILVLTRHFPGTGVSKIVCEPEAAANNFSPPHGNVQIL